MALWQLPATTLSALIDRGKASSRDVVRAHLDRIEAVDGRVHAFTEVLRDQAQIDADASDARRRRGESRGPLDGLPVSVKECFDIAGRETTLGLPSWRGRVAAADAALVEILREAGAVILGRTNLSQTMLFVESRNPIFGQTSNPWSSAHSPGGSSGGEAAAVAAGMSPLGFGTDIGGSIRVPATFCGISGIKPSLDRLPMRGYQAVLAGQEAVRGQGGPLARTVDDLTLVFRALDPRRMSELDPRVPPLAWEEPDTVNIAGLRVGYYVNDGILRASHAVARATERAATAVRARGGVVVAFEPPDVSDMLAAYLGALSADGGKALGAALAGGEVDPVLVPMMRLAPVPIAVRRVAAQVARALGQPHLALMLASMGGKSAGELWQVTARLRGHRAALLAAMDRERLDVLLCPAFATPALPHGMSKNFTVGSSYSILFNALQLPAGVVPVTRVRAGEATREATHDVLDRHAARVDAQSAGLPVGAQVVGRAWKEHVVLAVMRAIESEVGTDEDFPRTPVEPA
jgi:fatty acid amide hydrolase